MDTSKRQPFGQISTCGVVGYSRKFHKWFHPVCQSTRTQYKLPKCREPLGKLHPLDFMGPSPLPKAGSQSHIEKRSRGFRSHCSCHRDPAGPTTQHCGERMFPWHSALHVLSSLLEHRSSIDTCRRHMRYLVGGLPAKDEK